LPLSGQRSLHQNKETPVQAQPQPSKKSGHGTPAILAMACLG